MNITIEKLLQLDIDPQVAEFMRHHGTNHQKLVDYWGENPEDAFTDDFDTLLQCLAYAVQNQTPSVPVVMRILGRVRATRQVRETQEVQGFMETKKLLR